MKQTLFLLIMSLCGTICAAQTQFSDVKKGDIITINGVKGIVFQTDGEHGKAMCLKTFRGVKNAWCKSRKLAGKVSTPSRESGRENTNAVFQFVEENNVNISEFPVFAWCKSLGEGWYVPAVNELEQFINWWLGNDVELEWGESDESDDAAGVTLDETPHMKLVNQKIIEAGGIPFINGAYSSTENERQKLYVFGYNDKKKSWKFYTMSKSSIDTNVMGRAFYEF
jgi:hypothetical protein